MPEEIPFREEVMNICFKNIQILDHEKCTSLAKSKKSEAQYYINICNGSNPYIAMFNFEERFNITLDISRINFKPIMEFIQGEKNCYQNIKSNSRNYVFNSLILNHRPVVLVIASQLTGYQAR